MWKERKKTYLQSKIKETEEATGSGSYVTLTSTSAKPSGKAASLQSDLIFEEIGRRIKEMGSQLVKKVNAIFQWDITRDGQMVVQWTLDLKTGSGEIYQGASRCPADTVFTLSDHDFMQLVLGKIKPHRAFFVGRLKTFVLILSSAGEGLLRVQRETQKLPCNTRLEIEEKFLV
ncbi:SCP2 sterol-binding domain-containing protein 1 [Trachemys scripta elegans]|uniref:SCP2 sterol-binding domain-containing protein 1 n=1 Tax=Trachemys scripta elegans TaxID=31138 RepID=UPI0015521218|nr:SCP2 sterol-binding domain-containing protein 1 [Trachemys scripta elegans]